MTRLITQLIRDEGGQDLAEYGIALAIIGTAAGAAALVILADVNTLWANAKNVIHGAV